MSKPRRKTIATPQRFAAEFSGRAPGEQIALAKGLRSDVDRAIGTKSNDLQALRSELQGEGVLSAEAGSPAAKSLLKLQLKMAQGVVSEAAFRAYGCPTAIAVGEWLAASLPGQKAAEWSRISASGIRQALEIPDDRAHCALMGEDVIRALAQQI